MPNRPLRGSPSSILMIVIDPKLPSTITGVGLATPAAVLAE